DGMRAAPPAGVKDERGRMVFGEFRAEAAHLAKRRRADRVMRTDAERRPSGIVSGLQRAVHTRFDIQPSARGPAPIRVGVADAWGGDIPDPGIRERSDGVAQVIRRRDMIGIELRNEVVVLVSEMIVEIGEVALLAAGTPWPCFAVVLGDPVPGGE